MLLQAGATAIAAGGSEQAPAVTGLQRSCVTYDRSVVGHGDSLQIELLDIPKLSGTFSIAPDGTL